MKPLSCGRGAIDDPEGIGESGESGETGSLWCGCPRGPRYDETDDDDGPGVESAAYRSPGRAGLLDDDGVAWYVVRDIGLCRELGRVLFAENPSLVWGATGDMFCEGVGVERASWSWSLCSSLIMFSRSWRRSSSSCFEYMRIWHTRMTDSMMVQMRLRLCSVSVICTTERSKRLSVNLHDDQSDIVEGLLHATVLI